MIPPQPAENKMATSEHLFIHPWLHPDESWAGFQLCCPEAADIRAAALRRLAGHAALESLDRQLKWFVPVPSADCLPGALAFPEQQTVFLLRLASAGGDLQPEETLRTDIYRSGRKLGLILAPDFPLPLPGVWSHVLLEISQARSLAPFSLAALPPRTNIALTGLHSRSDLAWAISNRCSLVSGEYLLNRATSSNKPDMARMRLLELLALVSTDADSREIEEIFRQEPKLAYGLLRLVNSAAMAPRQPVVCFAQAIALLGRQQLQRWLQLLVFAAPNNGQQPNPLLLLAATRGRIMEILAAGMPSSVAADIPPDAAFMTGTFSLLDVLLNLSMPEILPQLPLHSTVQAALAEQNGALGRLLKALSAADNRDHATASRLLTDLGIDCETFLDAQLGALAWADKIRSGP